ncbi:MAG: MFS transporter [Simkania sp.]|nr:MFS transporter [Simkania sp.]MCP5490468.1 MFS transporter [Chlamydiales bacterium]
MKRLLPVLVVLFLGYLGFSLALPIFPPLFLDLSHSFLSPETSIAIRRILLGILFSMYPLGQFIGAPIMGKLSDKWGRKPVLLISLLAIIPGYIGCALSVAYRLPFLMYVSRFWVGLLEGNITIAQAAISDISEDEKAKTKNFGWMVSLSSSAFFFGPLIGGKLADSKLISWFHFDTPFWCAAFLVFVGFLIVLKRFKETHEADQTVEIHPFTIFTSFIDSLRIKRLRFIYLANMCFFFAIFFFLNFFSAYLVNVFGFNVSLLGEANAYLSIFVVIGPLFFGWMAKFWTTSKIALFGSVFMGISLIVFLLPNSPYALFATLIPVGFFMAIGFAYPALMISNIVSKRIQGQVLGTNMAIQVFGEGATALIGGFLMALFTSFPIWIGAIVALIGGALLISETRRPQQQHSSSSAS